MKISISIFNPWLTLPAIRRYRVLYFSFQPVLHDWGNKGRGMCYPVCGMVHIKEPLLLIGKSSPCGDSGFPLSLSEWSSTIILCQTPYNRKQNVLSASLNKLFPSFLHCRLCLGLGLCVDGFSGTFRSGIIYRDLFCGTQLYFFLPYSRSYPICCFIYFVCLLDPGQGSRR